MRYIGYKDLRQGDIVLLALDGADVLQACCFHPKIEDNEVVSPRVAYNHNAQWTVDNLEGGSWMKPIDGEVIKFTEEEYEDLYDAISQKQMTPHQMVELHNRIQATKKIHTDVEFPEGNDIGLTGRMLLRRHNKTI